MRNSEVQTFNSNSGDGGAALVSKNIRTVCSVEFAHKYIDMTHFPNLDYYYIQTASFEWDANIHHGMAYLFACFFFLRRSLFSSVHSQHEHLNTDIDCNSNTVSNHITK